MTASPVRASVAAPAAPAAPAVSAGCVDRDIGVLQGAVDGFDDRVEGGLLLGGQVTGEPLVDGVGEVLELGPSIMPTRGQGDAHDAAVLGVAAALDEAVGAHPVEV